MSPVVSVNVPDQLDGRSTGMKAGTVGRPLPGVATRVVDPGDGATVAGPGTPGLLLVKGAEPDARLPRQSRR